MRIISIDVGIKNLAYCILECNVEMNIYKVLQWDVINLCGEEHICTCALKEKDKKGKDKKGKDKKGKEKNNKEEAVISLCVKKATYVKGLNYYCQTHAKASMEYLLPNAALKNIKKWKREALVSFALAQGIVINDAWKKDELLKEIITYMEQKTLEKISTVSANEMTLVQMGVQLVKEFDRVLGVGGNAITFLDKIIIENQISPIANRMKTLQGMIAQYFIMRDNPQIAFISSANKLKLFTKKKVQTDVQTQVQTQVQADVQTHVQADVQTDVQTDVSTSLNKTTYNERKKAGVLIVKELLVKDNTEWLPIFLAHKKKDDLADAFLQGIWFLSKK